MKKTIALISILFSAITLVACNGSTGNNDGSGASLAKAVCTSSANWNAVGLGMSLSEVQGILGRPTETTVTIASTIYAYDACRGFVTAVDEKTGASSGTDVGVSVTWVGGRGVTAINAPARITGEILCEVDYYNYPKGSNNVPCRAANNPF